MDKEDVIHIYNGILLSHQKEQKWAIYRDMDGPRVCHTEWSKSERNKYHILTSMWNLEKWYWWTYSQGRNRDADIEKGQVDRGGRRGLGALGEWHWYIYTAVCETDSEWEPAVQHRELSSVLCDDLEGVIWGWCEGGPRAGDVCISLSHSVVSNSLWPSWTVAHQSPLSMEFSRQEYWSG